MIGASAERKAEAIRLFHDGDALKGCWIRDHLHFSAQCWHGEDRQRAGARSFGGRMS
jgi:hypothetical protein